MDALSCGYTVDVLVDLGVGVVACVGVCMDAGVMHDLTGLEVSASCHVIFLEKFNLPLPLFQNLLTYNQCFLLHLH